MLTLSIAKPRGVPGVDDQRVLNGIYWLADRFALGGHSGALPLATTCYNRLVRWRKLGVWDRLFEAVARAYEGAVQMVGSSSIRVHPHAANGKRGVRGMPPGTMLMLDAWGACAAG